MKKSFKKALFFNDVDNIDIDETLITITFVIVETHRSASNARESVIISYAEFIFVV